MEKIVAIKYDNLFKVINNKNKFNEKIKFLLIF